MQSRPQAPALLGLIALAAACVGCFVLLSSSEMSPVALAGKTSSAARMSALAEVSAMNGGGSQAIRSLLKGSLESSEKNEEGRLYEHALQRAGLKLGAAARKVIQMSLSKAGKKPASLGIDPSLQKQVVVAASIKKEQAAHIKHAQHKLMSDKLRLAEAILGGKKFTPKAAHAQKKAAPSARKTVSQSLEGELDSEDHMALAHMERRSMQPQRSQARQYLKSPEAASMMHQLSPSEQSQLLSSRGYSSHGLTQQGLETKEWAHSDDSSAEGHSSSAHSKLKNLPHKLDLTVGEGGDGTILKVFDGPQNSRIALEKQLRSELDGTASSLQQKDLMKVQLASSQPVVHDPASKTAHSLVNEGRMQMEAQLKGELEERNDRVEQAMFHKSLANGGLAIKPRKKSMWG